MINRSRLQLFSTAYGIDKIISWSIFASYTITAFTRGLLQCTLIVLYSFLLLSGLGFCYGKKYFCQDGGKPGKNGNIRQKLAKSLVHEIA